MQFITLDLALATQRAIVPLVRRVQRHDRRLAQQLRDATNSFVLAYSDPGTRRSRYQSSAGSASEVRVGLRAAVGWGYLAEKEVEPALGQLHQLLGALWRLTR